jgi:hypothetical protein
MFGVSGDEDEEDMEDAEGGMVWTGVSAPVVASTSPLPPGQSVVLLPPPFPRVFMLHPPSFETNRVRFHPTPPHPPNVPPPPPLPCFVFTCKHVCVSACEC